MDRTLLSMHNLLSPAVSRRYCFSPVREYFSGALPRKLLHRSPEHQCRGPHSPRDNRFPTLHWLKIFQVHGSRSVSDELFLLILDLCFTRVDIHETNLIHCEQTLGLQLHSMIYLIKVKSRTSPSSCTNIKVGSTGKYLFGPICRRCWWFYVRDSSQSHNYFSVVHTLLDRLQLSSSAYSQGVIKGWCLLKRCQAFIDALDSDQ